MRFAYEDVARAFDHYLATWNEGRPFVIASHSQGTHHGAILLREKIDGTPLAERLIAAYLIGGRLAASDFEGLRDITLCDGPDQTGCAVHWDTMSEKADPDPARASHVCVNPLTWRLDGGAAPASEHVGALPVSGRFQVSLMGDDAGTGMTFPPLGEPLRAYTGARCGDGVLYVDPIEGDALQNGLQFRNSPNYHGLDYPLFALDIRENAKQRVDAYLGAASASH